MHGRNIPRERHHRGAVLPPRPPRLLPNHRLQQNWSPGPSEAPHEASLCDILWAYPDGGGFKGGAKCGELLL